MQDQLLEFSQAEISPSGEMAIALTWLNHARPGRRPASTKNPTSGGISDVVSHQRVVGNREFHGQKVTQEQFDRREIAAHKCPFVQVSTISKQTWMMQSSLTQENLPEINDLLSNLKTQFVHLPVAFDPVEKNAPAGEELQLKCIVVFFPAYIMLGQHKEQFANIHEIQKPIFMKAGLALGQFYSGCDQGGIYNEEWPSLGSPYPAFAIRYLSFHDYLFNPPGSNSHSLYKEWFPGSTA